MAAWTQDGVRLDIALAVVMEVSVLDLTRAESADEQAEAVAFNAHLWRVAAELAETSPVAEDGIALRNTAALIAAGGRRMDQLVELNRCFARLLAGRAATDGGPGCRPDRRAGTTLEFGPWLLEVLDGFAARNVQSLAA